MHEYNIFGLICINQCDTLKIRDEQFLYHCINGRTHDLHKNHKRELRTKENSVDFRNCWQQFDNCFPCTEEHVPIKRI